MSSHKSGILVEAEPEPAWCRRNLISHHRKRTTGKEAGCFEDLLGIRGRKMTIEEYERRSLSAVKNPWAEYEAEKAHTYDDEFDERRAAYVDDDLVVAITDLGRESFVTCFHEHFDKPHGVAPGPNASVGQRRLRYKQQLKWDEQGGMIRNVKRIKGV